MFFIVESLSNTDLRTYVFIIGPKSGVQESGEGADKDPNLWLLNSNPSYTTDMDLREYTYKSEGIHAGINYGVRHVQMPILVSSGSIEIGIKIIENVPPFSSKNGCR